ncbi:MAG: protein kinase domain-containing protein, partial [Planctomycetaceae bacterium]
MNDRYQVDALLGSGAMGQVWRGHDLKTKRLVALKVLPLEARQNKEAIALVEAAFRLVEGLTHEGVCKALDLDSDRTFGSFLVMDFIEGLSLSNFVREYRQAGRSVNVPEVVRWLLPVAKGLDYAHKHKFRQPDGSQGLGVLHRDVKPENILIVRDAQGEFERSVLIDYGLAAEIRSTVTRVTNTQADMSGTLPYMAPEQVRGKRSQWDARTDQYSLAVVAYELLAGHLPFKSDDVGSLQEAIKSETPDPISRLPANVNAALIKGLSKERDQRYPTCRQLLNALSEAVDQKANAVDVQVQEGSTRVVATVARPTLSDEGSQAGEERDDNGLKMKFVWCPPGQFTMGSPETEQGRGDDEDQV